MDVNWKILLIQLGIFVYCLLALHYLIFSPLMKILKRRDEMTVGKASAAEDLDAKLNTMKAQYDSQIADLRDALESSRHETLKKNRELSDAKVKQAKSRVDRQISEKRTLIEQEADRVRSKIPQLSDDLAQDILQSITNSRVVRS